MARYGTEHKRATRDRILETAGLRFRQDGFDGSGVATLMKDAGLTNGAFYAHFASKDDLVAEVVARQLRDQAAALDDPASGLDGLGRLAREYLSAAHRDGRREGCPSAALLGEVARGTPEAREAYTGGLLGLADAVAAYVVPDDPARVRVPVVVVLATLIGTLQVARALTDDALSGQVLDEGRRQVVAAFAAMRATGNPSPTGR